MADKSRKQQIEEMLVDQPDDPFLLYGLAMEYVSEGDDEVAMRQFEKLFQAAPDYVPGYHQAGQACLRIGRADQARAILDRGIAAALQQGDLHAVEEMRSLLVGPV